MVSLLPEVCVKGMLRVCGLLASRPGVHGMGREGGECGYAWCRQRVFSSSRVLFLSYKNLPL